ncbi:acyl-CoA dehydrogenase family protein [Myceligenerans xiligouense]|uniref:Alkylation response protein AidB-like acyl-CoA dehydrogenase n=1 Tax=Myceligenerans xiligouense TaxID=253184 RepID=A0A3N4Z1W0_9MICO|nr:acyl-CoA dehydrogenase family protein [Myceligenerans xiligouense]RPF20018.1 alkylation response protein AidB-like acyl-CoA dehydrogenase [Myceligenerans xiligouense]
MTDVATTQSPTLGHDLLEVVRAHTPWQEENRRTHPEVLEALHADGHFAMRVPARHGGLELSHRDVLERIAALSKADGATGWVVAVSAITSWMVSTLPDEVQDEVFADGPVQTCGTLSPGGQVTADGDDYLLNGRWQFISGAPSSAWQTVIAVVETPQGPMPVLGAVPIGDLELVDDWHTSGLRGSGSFTTVAQDVRVPRRNFVPLPAMLAEQYASERNSATPVFSTPLVPTAAALSVGVAVGLAEAGLAAFLDRLPGRKITYTAYDDQAEAPVTHLALGESSMLVDESRYQAQRLADMLDDTRSWDAGARVLARACLGRACELAHNSADVLNANSGGSSIYDDVPIQRIARDLHAMRMHALIHPVTNRELLGRVLAGLAPHTQYL